MFPAGNGGTIELVYMQVRDNFLFFFMSVCYGLHIILFVIFRCMLQLH